MKEVGCEEQIPKLEEYRIDQEVFWGLEDNDFKTIVDIQSFGNRKTLMRRIKEIKDEHEKEMEEKHKQEKSVNKNEVKTLLEGTSS